MWGVGCKVLGFRVYGSGFMAPAHTARPTVPGEREIFVHNLLVRVHLIIEISRPALRHGSLNSPGSMVQCFRVQQEHTAQLLLLVCLQVLERTASLCVCERESACVFVIQRASV